jgi:hypothetical protein
MKVRITKKKLKRFNPAQEIQEVEHKKKRNLYLNNKIKTMIVNYGSPKNPNKTNNKTIKLQETLLQLYLIINLKFRKLFQKLLMGPRNSYSQMILINNFGTIPYLLLSQSFKQKKMLSGVIGLEETEETVANSLNSKEIREEVIDKEDLIMEMKDSKIVESKAIIDLVRKIKIAEIILIIGRERIEGEDLEVISIIVVMKTDKFERDKKASSKVIEETEIIIIIMEM